LEELLLDKTISLLTFLINQVGFIFIESEQFRMHQAA